MQTIPLTLVKSKAFGSKRTTSEHVSSLPHLRASLLSVWSNSIPVSHCSVQRDSKMSAGCTRGHWKYSLFWDPRAAPMRLIRRENERIYERFIRKGMSRRTNVPFKKQKWHRTRQDLSINSRFLDFSFILGILEYIPGPLQAFRMLKHTCYFHSDLREMRTFFNFWSHFSVQRRYKVQHKFLKVRFRK